MIHIGIAASTNSAVINFTNAVIFVVTDAIAVFVVVCNAVEVVLFQCMLCSEFAATVMGLYFNPLSRSAPHSPFESERSTNLKRLISSSS